MSWNLNVVKSYCANTMYSYSIDRSSVLYTKEEYYDIQFKVYNDVHIEQENSSLSARYSTDQCYIRTH